MREASHILGAQKAIAQESMANSPYRSRGAVGLQVVCFPQVGINTHSGETLPRPTNEFSGIDRHAMHN
jgi:hypothetical protein